MQLKMNNAMSLMVLYDEYKNKQLLIPDHQRQSAWTEAKQQQWWQDIQNNPIMPGCIITYNIAGSSARFINDGAQRAIYSIGSYISFCESQNRDYRTALYKCTITVQHLEYDNVSEAIKHFHNLNVGTTATPYELMRSLFVEELQGFTASWEPLLQDVHSIVEAALSRLGCKVEESSNDPKSRMSRHTKKRDTYNLFYRFLSGDKSKFSPQVAAKQINMDEWETATELERKFIAALKSTGLEEVRKAIDNFRRYINEKTSMYEQIWVEKQKRANAPANVHIRWWLLLSMYWRNNGFSPKRFREFTVKLIEVTGGRTSVFYTSPTGQQNNTNCALAKLGNLPTVMRGIGCNVDEFCVPEKRESTSNELLKPGYVKSHINSFSANGNGEVVFENAIDNRLRGNRDITEKELEELQPINSCPEAV